MSTPARISTISPSLAVSWSDGTPFTGYYLFVLRQPSDGVTPWIEADVNTNQPGLTLPNKILFPIIQGTPNTSLGLYYNSDITPPTTQYIAYLYDSGKRQVAGPSAAFTISASPFTPPVLTPTIPSTYGPNPTPDS